MWNWVDDGYHSLLMLRLWLSLKLWYDPLWWKGYNLYENMHANMHLTHWGRVMHICITKLTIIGSDNGLSPGRRQAIIWTNAGILSIWPLGTHFNEILIDIYIFSLKKMHMKMSFGKRRLSCLGLNVLSISGWMTVTHQFPILWSWH